MKKKVLFILTLLFSFLVMNSVNATEINTIYAEGGTVPNEKLNLSAGNWNYVSGITPEDQYEVRQFFCSVSTGECFLEPDFNESIKTNNPGIYAKNGVPYFTSFSDHLEELTIGKYEIGYIFQIQDTSKYQFSSNPTIYLNNKKTNPESCIRDGNNALACYNFHTVEFYSNKWQDPNQKKVTRVDVKTKTDYKIGDVPSYDFTYPENSGYYVKHIKWIDAESIDSPTNDNVLVKKFERKKYYLMVHFEIYPYPDYEFADNDGSIVYVNGVKNTLDPVLNGKGSDGFFEVAVYELDLTKTQVIPEDSKDKTETAAAKEVNNVVNKALDDIANNKQPVGITAEVANKVLNAIQEGKTLSTDVEQESKKESEVSEEVKEEVSKVATNDTKVLGYFDISISIKANDVKLGNVTEIPENITIVLNTRDMVAKLPTVAKGKTRVFKVLRIHGDKIDVLPGRLNSNGDVETDTNLFSDYVVMYEDVNTPVDTNVKYNAATYDGINIYFGLFIISLVSLIILTKKYINE